MGQCRPFPRPDGKPGASRRRATALAHERVRFVGEAVAAVVAETREAGPMRAEAVLVDYEDLPIGGDAATAMAPGAPALCDDAPGQHRRGDAPRRRRRGRCGVRAAAHVVSLDIVNQRLAPSPMEPRACAGRPIAPAAGWSCACPARCPRRCATALADAHARPDRGAGARAVGDVGGGFGMKTGMYPEDIAVAFAAWTLKRPVKWCAERSEEFLGAVHGRDVPHRAELALDANGKRARAAGPLLCQRRRLRHGTGVAIQLLIGPWVSDQHLRHPDDRLHLTR
jgi:carbon-monoxide dehydrogenase large subunit